MSYTPVELRHVRVGRSLFGYNRKMVEQVIEEVAESFEATWRERGELAERVEVLEKQLEEHRQREQLLTHTLVAAEQTASDVRDRARREAEAVITEAHNEARAISRAAAAERERLLTESRRIEAMLRAALGLLEQRPGGEPPARSAHASEPAPAPSRSALVSSGAVERSGAPPALPQAPEEVGWTREDTREFAPLEPEGHAEQAAELLEERRTPAEAVLQRLPGSESRDFDWGE